MVLRYLVLLMSDFFLALLKLGLLQSMPVHHSIGQLGLHLRARNFLDHRLHHIQIAVTILAKDAHDSLLL